MRRSLNVGRDDTNNNLFKHVGLSVLESLKQKAQRVSKKHENVQEYFALFSKSGFSSELIEYSKSHPFIKLYSLEEL